MMRDTRCKELGAVRPGLPPRGRCNHHVYAAGPAGAAPQSRNAAPPRSLASKTALSRGLTSMKGAPPGQTRGWRGRREGTRADTPLAAAPPLIGPGNLRTRASRPAEGRRRGQNTPLAPLRSLIGLWSLRVRFWKVFSGAHAKDRLRIGCSWAVERFLWGTTVVTEVARLGQPGTQVRDPARAALGARGRASRQSPDAAGTLNPRST